MGLCPGRHLLAEKGGIPQRCSLGPAACGRGAQQGPVRPPFVAWQGGTEESHGGGPLDGANATPKLGRSSKRPAPSWTGRNAGLGRSRKCYGPSPPSARPAPDRRARPGPHPSAPPNWPLARFAAPLLAALRPPLGRLLDPSGFTLIPQPPAAEWSLAGLSCGSWGGEAGSVPQLPVILGCCSSPTFPDLQSGTCFRGEQPGSRT